MISLVIMTLTFLIISSFLMFINLTISKKSHSNREKSSPFECGFDPMSNSRIPFSIQFFIISLIFLIFDIEMSLLIPLIIMSSYMNKIMIYISLMFMLILIAGLFIEYMEMSLDWKY